MKLILKKASSLLLSVAIFLSLFAIPALAAESIKLNTEKLSLAVGETYTLKLSGIGTNDTVKWSASDKKIVTIDAKGKVSAKSKGKATVSAKVNNKTYKCEVSVSTYRIKADKQRLQIGEILLLSAKGSLNGKTPIWSSSNPKIASINKSGVVTARSAGQVKISCKIDKSTVSINLRVEKKSQKPVTLEEEVPNQTTEEPEPTTPVTPLVAEIDNPKPIEPPSEKENVDDRSKKIDSAKNSSYYHNTNIRTFTDVTGVKMEGFSTALNSASGNVVDIYSYKLPRKGDWHYYIDKVREYVIYLELWNFKHVLIMISEQDGTWMNIFSNNDYLVGVSFDLKGEDLIYVIIEKLNN